jgi:replication factor C large subunit
MTIGMAKRDIKVAMAMEPRQDDGQFTVILLTGRSDYVMMVESWAEKYRPKRLDEVEGNPKAVSELRHWAEVWESRRFRKGDRKAVILVGGPGTGKTSSALALAADFRWGVVELNASDARNASAIRKTATVGALSETFTSNGDYLKSAEGGEKLIVLDEADNIFGREDQGGLQAIVETIERTRQPIVLIANDYYELSRRSGKLKDLCQVIRFLNIKPETVRAVLKKVAAAENIKVDPEVIGYISEHSEGDMRSAVNDLQSIAEGKNEVTIDDLKSVGYRDVKKTIFGSIQEIFRTTSAKTAKDAVTNLDEQPDFIILWLDENLPLAYRDPADLQRGFDALSKADIYIGRTNRKKQFSLWKYAIDLMTVGVALAKKKGHGSGGGYQFPSWLRKMAQHKGVRATGDSLSAKIARYCHTSRTVAKREILPFFRYIFSRVKEFRIGMIAELELEDGEVAFLLGEPVDSNAVRHAVLEAAKASGGKPDASGEKDFEEPAGRQKSLF